MSTLASSLHRDSAKALLVQRHPTLYLSTGDVVLSADQLDVRYMFCVHKNTLAHYSPVFADMFTLGLSAKVDVNDSYEGLPVVHLYDEGTDVEDLLVALYGLGYVAESLVHS